MITITTISRIISGDIPGLPDEPDILLADSAGSAELVGVGVPVSVTSGKSSAIEGKGARVAVLVDVTVPVDTSVSSVGGNGVKMFEGKRVLVAGKIKVVAEGIRVGVLVRVGVGVNVGLPGVIVLVDVKDGVGDMVPVRVAVGERVAVAVIGVTSFGSERTCAGSIGRPRRTINIVKKAPRFLPK